jgi:uncharacterized protein involved in outer membrane biogenesis
MKRTAKIIGLVLAACVLLLGLLIIGLSTFDWNRARPLINDKVSQASGRPFAINGDLKLSWQRQQGEEDGWRARIPWPHFSASDVSMGNPEWSKAGGDMARLGRIDFSVNPLALLGKHIQIPTIVLRQPDLVLERAADGRANWTFKQSETESPWKLELGRVQLTEGKVRYIDAIRHADIRVQVEDLEQPDEAGNQMRWSLQGKLEKETVKGSGRAGPLLALRESSTPYPFAADVRVGPTRLRVNGTVARPRSQMDLDLRLDLSGPSMAALTPISTVLLPETSPYSTSGHLKGQMDEAGGKWTYQDFTGKVGQSDIAGSLEYKAGKRRPRLSGKLESKLLRIEDLGALIGAPPEDDRSKTEVGRKYKAKTDKQGRVLPDKAFSTKSWKTLDADIQFNGHKIVRSTDFPVENLQTHLKLDDGVLNLSPLNFGFAGGRMESQLKLDGSNEPLQAQMTLKARNLRLNQLAPKVESSRASVGHINGDAKLSGRGNSVAALLAGIDGEVKTMMDRGTISKFLLEAVGLNIGSVVVTQLFGDRQVNINCAVGDFVAQDGVMKVRNLVVDTTDAVINVNGQINLAQEQLDLVINPDSRNLRIFSLRSPIYVRGTLGKPDIDVDRAVLVAKTGGAIALGVLAPIVTALVPLVNAGGTEEDSGCRALLAQAKKPAEAPAPARR